MKFESTKIIELGSCAFRQWRASHSHCKFLHGYRLTAKFWFTCTDLDDKNWVVDFGGLDELKKILQTQFDHTFCVAADDPELETFKQLHSRGVCDLRIMENGVGIERTAEYCFDIANTYIKNLTNDRCWVEKVEVWEHEKNSAVAVAREVAVITEPQQPIAVTIPAPVATTPTVTPTVNLPAAVGSNKVTTGYSGLFDNISWGRK